jgi:putative heme-binding domain-containing protein
MKTAVFAIMLFGCPAFPALAQQAGTAAPNPFIGNSQAVSEGKAAYDEKCTACHGANGEAGERAPAIVLANVNGPLRGERTDAQLLRIIRSGIAGSQMPAWAGQLPDDSILKIVAYIHALRSVALDAPLPGNPAHGEEVFWGKGGCGQCHMIYGRGGVVGPDLSDIAATYKATVIVDALTKEQHKVVGDGGVHLPVIPPMDRNPVQVMTKDGHTISGVMLNQDSYSVQFMDLDGQLHSLDRGKLSSVTIKPGSVMPADYDKRLSKDEFADLLAFLTRQGKKPAPSSQSRPAAE